LPDDPAIYDRELSTTEEIGVRVDKAARLMILHKSKRRLISIG
jgi:hypothetical protein